MPAGDQRLPKQKRLLKRAQFLALNQGAGRAVTENFLFLWRANGLPCSRLGITVTKRIASAVGRNRVKRLVREAFRLEGAELPLGLDLVVVARSGAPGLALAAVREQMGQAARRMAKGLGNRRTNSPPSA